MNGFQILFDIAFKQILLTVVSLLIAAMTVASAAGTQVQTSVGNSGTKCLRTPQRLKKRVTVVQQNPNEPISQAEPPTIPTNNQPMSKPAPLAASTWQDSVIKAIAGGGLALVSLSFAAFTFLYGALLGLRDENRLDPRVRMYKRKLAGAIYGTALAVGGASILVVLVFI